MRKVVEIASPSAKRFVEAIIFLAKKGGTLMEDEGVFKGSIMRAKMEVEEDVLIPSPSVMRVIPKTKKEREEYIKQQAAKLVIERNETRVAKKAVAKKAAKKAVKKVANETILEQNEAVEKEEV